MLQVAAHQQYAAIAETKARVGPIALQRNNFRETGKAHLSGGMQGNPFIVVGLQVLLQMVEPLFMAAFAKALQGQFQCFGLYGLQQVVDG